MQIHDMPQGSPEWLALRAQWPTASEFSNLITPAKLQVSKSMGGYVARKLAEKWLGYPLESFGSGAMDQGTVREESAWTGYAAQYSVDIARPGFIVADDGLSGCSPDGLILAVERGLEIKCPQADTHVRYLLDGQLPDEYRLQVQGSMLVTGYQVWTFRSYCVHFPPFDLDVPRDEEVIAALREGLEAYWSLFNEGWAALVAKNGGMDPAIERAKQEAAQQ